MSAQHTPPDIGEYDAVVNGAAWRDRRDRGRLRFEGTDAASFLHALVSNDVASLREGHGVYAVYLTPQGRLIADLTIHHRGGRLLMDVPPGLGATLAARFDELIFAEDVRVSDVSDSTAALLVTGARASPVLALTLRTDREALDALEARAGLTIGGAFVARADDFAGPAFDVFVPAENYDDVVAGLGLAGALPMSAGVYELLRIETGRPEFGVDMTAETIPLEAGLLDRAIDLGKGCYVGQEVIVRVLHRGGGRVAKRLVRLVFDSSDAPPPAAGAAIVAEGKQVGRVTSSAWSPSRRAGVALGYLHRDAAEIGRRVTAGGQAAEVVGFAG